MAILRLEVLGDLLQIALSPVDSMLTAEIVHLLFFRHGERNDGFFFRNAFHFSFVSAAGHLQILLTLLVNGFADLTALLGFQELVQKDVSSALSLQLSPVTSETDNVRTAYEIGQLDHSVTVIK